MLVGILACAAPDLAVAPGAPSALEVSLAGGWREGAASVLLPWPGDVHSFAVSHTLVLPDAFDPSTPAVLALDATGWTVRVTLDGREVGRDVGGVRPVEVDLTGRLRPGSQELGLAVEAAPEGMSPWTGDEPRPGQAIARGAPTLRLTPPDAPGQVHAGFEGDRVTAEATAPPGARLRFRVVRDGAVRQELGEAVAGADGRATLTTRWTGPRWTPARPELAWVVVEDVDGARAQSRVGARTLAREGRRLTVDGGPAYLVSTRWSKRAGTVRDDVAAISGLIAAYGANALELHAAELLGEVADAADELGLHLVVTPICDGRRRAGPIDDPAAWRAHVLEGHRRLAARLGGHPSLALWNVELTHEVALAVLSTPFLGLGVPVIDLRESQGVPEAGEPFGGGVAPWLNELPWRGLAGAEDRLDAVLAAHRDQGIGLALPDRFATHSGTPAELAWTEGVRERLAAHGVEGWTDGRRRGVAVVEVQVLRGGSPVEGQVVLLRAPEMAPVAAASDAAGWARLALDHAGAATVEAWGAKEPVEVRLQPGTWESGAWRPSPVRVELALP